MLQEDGSGADRLKQSLVIARAEMRRPAEQEDLMIPQYMGLADGRLQSRRILFLIDRVLRRSTASVLVQNSDQLQTARRFVTILQ
ncbi:hypothetical protein AB4Z40_03470 [Bosea sp. 2YAB26]|uniref:hypothetical protein n=1 Tax=Bosea sp. 2YAB26 TaxID=3237478 RepID=UPI003F93494A